MEAERAEGPVEALNTIYGIVERDLHRAVRQKSRLVGGLARPFMWLLLVATGYNTIARVDGTASYHAFVFPGLVVMAALFGGTLTAISTVYDREFGLLRLMLAAPSGVLVVLVGRAVAATLVGLLQGGLVLLVVPLVLSVTWMGVATAAGVLVLGAAVSSVTGLLVAAPLRSVENFAGIINLVLFPLVFLSGALYPTAGFPPWLRAVARLNPVTYAVDLMRNALGQPTEFSPLWSIGVLVVYVLAAFALSAWLFDPEQRLVWRGRAKS